MSLTDKVIKNTFYHVFSQVIGFIFPFLMTPYMISKIGQVEFGIYAIVLGFIGTFGLFDLSLSTSFIKFISEHYNKNEFEELNHTITTGLFFYIIFSLLVFIVGYIFTDFFLNLINVPPDLISVGRFALRISLVIFFIATPTTIFSCILISLQKMYLNSLIGVTINFINFLVAIFLLYSGFGLRGVLYSQFITVLLSGFITVIISKKELPQMKLSFSNMKITSFKKMSAFGVQMQVNKVASFLSDKYDELLLGYFSVLNNVTFYNLAGRICRLGKFIPIQLFQQAAPVAAELNAKNEQQKLLQLFYDSTKYLTLISIPIFVFIFAFSDVIFISWVGKGYDTSVFLLRILAVGQIVNLMLSAPGNSIIPNLGIPKYLMKEGLISLGINLVLSFILIKYYGIYGAAIGNSIAIIISSIYIFITSAKYFRENKIKFLYQHYLVPLLWGIASCVIIYLLFLLSIGLFKYPENRIQGIVYIFISISLYISLYSIGLFKFKYIDDRDKGNLKKFFKLFTKARSE